jgi:hypothetical protein
MCRCCNKPVDKIFVGRLLILDVTYYECNNCGYVQTEEPYWLDIAYEEAINDSDTGIMLRNQINARIVMLNMMILGIVDKTLVDCAGGYGILVRLLRDLGINALWQDPYCKNIFAKGFEYKNERAGLVTAFEAFEHFINPGDELDKMLAIAPNVLISTAIISDPVPSQKNWWYYGREHGQHIGFFRVRTLKKLARDRGKYLLSNGTSYHLITDKPINHLLWKIMMKFNFFTPLLLRYRLKSKVWDDHFLMVKKQ